MSSFKPLIALTSSDLFILFECMLLGWLWLIERLCLRKAVMGEDEEDVSG
jgi:hypothetical protein